MNKRYPTYIGFPIIELLKNLQLCSVLDPYMRAFTLIIQICTFRDYLAYHSMMA